MSLIPSLEANTGNPPERQRFRQFEENFKRIFENAPVGIFLSTVDRLVTANASLARMFGYESPEEMVAGALTPEHFLVNPGQRHQMVTEAMRAGTYVRQEVEYRRKDGSVFTANLRMRAVRDGAGEIKTLEGFVEDVTEQKRAEEKLRQSEEKHRVLFESSRDAIMTLEPATGRFTSGNPAALQLFGAKDEEEFLVFTPMALSPERQPDGSASAQKAWEMIGTAQREGSHFFEWTHRRINGKEFVANVLLTRMEQSGKSAIQATVRDITGQKLAERQIVEIKNYAQSLLAASPIGIITYQASGRCVSANEAAARLVGTTVENLKQQNFRELDSWKKSSFLKLADMALKTGREQRFENHTVSSYGADLWLSCRFVPFVFEGNSHLLLLAQDLTERRRAENQLHESQEKFRQLAENIDHVFWICNKDAGEILYVSPAYERIWGRSCQSLYQRGTSFVEAILPADRERVRASLEKAKQGENYEEEYRILRPDGSMRWIHDRGFIVRDENGEFYRRAGLAQDVSERKQLEEQLRQAQKMEAIGQLAGGVAHDFNNILAATLMHMGLLQQAPELTLGAKTVLKEVEGEIMRAASLTRQLLLFSRRQMARVETLDLNGLIAALLKMLGRLLGENIEIKFQGSSDAAWVCVDAGMMEQVVMNLCINARDAMPKGGRLTLGTTMAEFGNRPAGSNLDARPGRFVCLSVTDTGCGMSETVLKRIFEPFFTTKEVGKGTGLGLATVYGIVKQHEGWVEVDSAVGQGSSFRVYLPAGVIPEESSRNFRDPEEIKGGSETILLVEDDLSLRRVAALCLRKLGYAVLDASNGEEALKLWARHHQKIGLLLTDVVMPGAISGSDLAKRLRAEKTSLRIVISSGFSAELKEAPPGSEAEVAYLAKPYETVTLAKIVRRCLDKC